MRKMSKLTLACVLAALVAGPAALGDEPPVPPNDECVDALPFDTGTCKASGAVCHRNADCAASACSYDGTNCTADPGLCTHHDLCANKLCTSGPNLGAACLSDTDCGGDV